MKQMYKNAVIVNDTRVDGHCGSDRVMETLISLLENNGMKVTATSIAHIDWRLQDHFLKALEAANVIIVNGEGTIHHDRIEGKWLLEAGKYGRANRIPCILLNTTWNNNGVELAELARAFNLISVRETKSFVELDKLGIRSEVIPDLSIYKTISPLTLPQSSRQGIGFTDSVDRQSGSALNKLRKKIKDSKVISIQYSGSSILNIYKFFRSYIALKDLSKPLFLIETILLRALQFRDQNNNDGDFILKLMGLKLLVSGRYHACTMALLAETPFIASNTNSHKILGLIDDSGLNSWRVNSCISTNDINHAIKAGWDEEEKQAVKNYISEGRLKTDRFFDSIKKLL